MPSQWLGTAEVWRAPLPKLPLTAPLRNLARITANGALTAESEARQTRCASWATVDSLRKARIHPIAAAPTAFNTYAAGRGMRGAWQREPIPRRD